jgi:hypothetical protein
VVRAAAARLAACPVHVGYRVGSVVY